MESTKLLRIMTILYGVFMAGIWGSVFISWYRSGDLMLLQSPRHLEDIGGEVLLLVMILWGILFALYGFWKRWEVGLFCGVVASIVTLLMWFQLGTGDSSLVLFVIWGIAFPVILFWLPLVSVIKALAGETSVVNG
nr:hypothetical protein [Ardenticatena sp.]